MLSQTEPSTTTFNDEYSTTTYNEGIVSHNFIKMYNTLCFNCSVYAFIKNVTNYKFNFLYGLDNTIDVINI